MRLAIYSLLIAGLVLVFGGAAGAQDKIPAEAYQRVNQALLENHILPRYEELAYRTESFVAAARDFCAAPGEEGLRPLRENFNRIVDAWMDVQHLRFGPVELFMRAQRLYFWPEARGKIDDALRDLLAAGDRNALAPEAFRKVSVAAQGLPALEVLLYEDDGRPLLAAQSSQFRCLVLQAIAENVHAMASDILAEWRGGSFDYAAKFIHPGESNPYYRSARDATLDLFKSLHNELQLIGDIKLAQVLGETPEQAKPRNAEALLSGRAAHNIAINLETLAELYLGGGGAGLGALARESGTDPELDPLLRRAFSITIGSARRIQGTLSEAVVDPVARPEVERLLTQVVALKQIVKTRLAAALDLSVGFNALDGD